MKQWEHLRTEVCYGIESIEEWDMAKADELGSQGRELVGVAAGGTDANRLHFKCEKQS